MYSIVYYIGNGFYFCTGKYQKACPLIFAREVEVLTSDAVSSLARFEPCSILPSSLAPPALLSIPKDKYLSSRRPYKIKQKLLDTLYAQNIYIYIKQVS